MSWTDPDYHIEETPPKLGWVFLISALIVLGAILYGMYEGIVAVI